MPTKGSRVQQVRGSTFRLQIFVAVNTCLAPHLDEPCAATVFLVAGTASGREQHAVGVVRRRVMAAQAGFFRDRTEIHTTNTGVAGIALLSKSGVRGRDRTAGERLQGF